MKIYNASELSEGEISALCARSAIDFAGINKIVEEVVSQVRKKGDEALADYTKKFDGVDVENIKVERQEIDRAGQKLSEELKKALKQSFANIKKFHGRQLREKIEVETMGGVFCSAEMRPIDEVGLYIPGGSAPLPSTVLMLGVPAVLAGCREIVMCTPPDTSGNVPPSILYAAGLCGIEKVYKVGGAQSIAAMAYGTDTVPKVYKIFGPGNQYVTAAKMQVSIDPDGSTIDMPAGPTELLVIADASARTDFVAADLLSQAEHGPDSQVVLVCLDMPQAESIFAEINKQIETLPRKDIAKKALAGSFALIVDSLYEALNFSNIYAPEHLILNVENAEEYTDKVSNVGSVFLGQYSPESAGDYASGTNHSLPTYGYARTYSGVSVESFQKRITFQKLTREGAKNIASSVINIAAEEQLDAHKRAMEIRLND